MPNDSTNNTVLIIDDSENVRVSLKKVLEGITGIEKVLLADNGLQGYKLLRENQIDLVLCDLNMPGIDGYKFLNLKGSSSEFNDIPVIMLTGQSDVSSKVRGLEVGASDYLVKPYDDAELVARVRVHLKVKHLQSQLRTKNEELEKLTRTDPLTGVANRRYLFETLSNEYHRSLRYHRPLSLVMLDIDFFKKVNDTHGHQAGDQALIIVASALKHELRMHDFIARYGGEEFAILLPETRDDDAIVAATRCRKSIEVTPIVHGKIRFSVTVSMGLSSLPNENVDAVDALIKLADEALFEAKRTGRNRLVQA